MDSETRVLDRGEAGRVPEPLHHTPSRSLSIDGGVRQGCAHDSAVLHVTGAARYIDDLPELPGTLHIYVAQSTYAHARLIRLDLQDVRRAPGVACAVSATDIPGINDASPVFGDDPVFAEDILEYAGQSLFAVAADTVGAARKA